MKTSLLNQQKNHPLQLKNLQKLTDWLARRLEERTAPDTWGEVCVVLADNSGITQTNREYFGKNRPTDVISFRYDPVPGEDEGWSGDLIINIDRAAEEGPARGSTADRELALYIAHGFDHLAGSEDDTPAKRRKMLATETAWLDRAAEDGIPTALFT